MPDFLSRTISILAQAFDIPIRQVHSHDPIDSLGRWDSHRFLNLVLALEEEFDIEFEPEDVEDMLTVEGIARIVEKRVNEPS